MLHQADRVRTGGGPCWGRGGARQSRGGAEGQKPGLQHRRHRPRAYFPWSTCRARPRVASPAICWVLAGGGGRSGVGVVFPAPCPPLLPARGPPASSHPAAVAWTEHTAGTAPGAEVPRDGGPLRRDAGRGGRNDQQVRAVSPPRPPGAEHPPRWRRAAPWAFSRAWAPAFLPAPFPAASGP